MTSSADSEHIHTLVQKMGEMRLLHAELLDHIAVMDREQVAQHVGYASTARLIAEVLHLNAGQASKLVLHAGLVTESLTPTGHVTPAPLPNVRAALREGLLDPAHVDAIAHTMKQVPDWVNGETRELVEKTLADTARSEAPRTVRRHGDILLDHLDQDGANPRDKERETEPGNIFRYRRVRGGRMKFTGELEPETAELLEALLERYGKPESPAPGVLDPRSAEERHGDALAEIVHHRKGSPRVRLSVHLDINQLLEGIGTATLDSGHALSPAAVRRLACDAGMVPMVLNSKSVPLNVGRARRLVSDRQRDALVARDRGCAYPGCCAPARWADAHHIKHVRHEARDFRMEVKDLRRLIVTAVG